MLKVLNVNIGLDSALGGGTAERTRQLSRFLAKRGVRCTVLSTDLGRSRDHCQSMRPAEVVFLPLLWKRFYVPKMSLKAIHDLVKNVDVINLMGHWTLMNAVVYLFARIKHRPYVVCPAGALRIYGRSISLKRVYNYLIGRRIIRDAAGHIAITETEIADFASYGISREKVVVIPNAIAVDDFASYDGNGFRLRFGLDERPFILFMGRLNYIKGPDLLLRAFGESQRELHGYSLVFAGPDEGLLKDLRQMAVDLKISERTKFVGPLDGQDKIQAYHAAKLVVIPSRQEAMSIVLLEAGVVGTPVLLTDRCGFNEIAIADGCHVVPASVEGLKRGLMAMLDDGDKLLLMGKNLQALVQDRFSWDKMIEQYLLLYRTILNSSAGS